jgi:hypothetical protein
MFAFTVSAAAGFQQMSVSLCSEDFSWDSSVSIVIRLIQQTATIKETGSILKVL